MIITLEIVPKWRNEHINTYTGYVYVQVTSIIH